MTCCPLPRRSRTGAAAPGCAGCSWPNPSCSAWSALASAATGRGALIAIAELQQFLLGRAIQARFGDPTVVAAARQILARRGDLSIDELARASFASPRALRRRFQSSLGAGPKALARAARFEHVRALLWEDPDAELSAVALAAGYADQAHMQREFRQFSQRTPRVFAEEMRQVRRLFGAPGGRNLQDS
ncbi:MAG: helix-turn-helix domain-containing protein [Kouleothrix sp.]